MAKGFAAGSRLMVSWGSNKGEEVVGGGCSLERDPWGDGGSW